MKIQESAQDYLESILILSRRQGNVRATDICSYFGYARATVSVFIHQLEDNGYVVIDENRHISLTDEGRQIAEEMLERHEFFSDFFIRLGVDEQTARNDACRIEHYISEQTFRALQKAAEQLLPND